MEDAQLPDLLIELLETGLWQTPGSDVDPRVDAEIARAWDPGSSGIHLHEPVAFSLDVDASGFYKELGVLDGVDSEMLIVIADFGLGADNPIVLDTFLSPAPVRTLEFRDEGARWKTIAPDFNAFASMIGLVADD